MSTFDAVYAVLDNYPDDLRSLFLDSEIFLDSEPDSEPNPNSGEATPKLPHIKPKDAKKKSKKSAKKTARRRASIRERLNSYVRDYSVDLQSLFDDIVATDTESTSTNPGGAENQDNQSQSIRSAVYGAQYLKERLGIMLKRAKISVMPLTKKESKKQCVKRKSHARLLDKLEILRKKFQLIKKAEQSLEEKQNNVPCPAEQSLAETQNNVPCATEQSLAEKRKSSPCPANPVKKIRKKRKKKIIKKKVKQEVKQNKKSKKEARKTHIRNLKIKKKQGIRRRLGSPG